MAGENQSMGVQSAARLHGEPLDRFALERAVCMTSFGRLVSRRASLKAALKKVDAEVAKLWEPFADVIGRCPRVGGCNGVCVPGSTEEGKLGFWCTTCGLFFDTPTRDAIEGLGSRPDPGSGDKK